MSSKWNINLDFTKKQTISLKKNRRNLLIKAALTAAILTATSFGFAFSMTATASADESFEKVFHVYVGDQYVGAVSNEAAVTEVIEEKEHQAKETYKNLHLDGSSQVAVIPEQVFSSETDDSSTLSRLDEELVVEAESYALQVDGQSVIYLKDEAAYHETFRLLKLEYVSESELKQYEANASVASLPALKKDETRVKEIKIAESVSGENTMVNPAEILTPRQAVDVLKTGALEKEVYKVQQGDVLGSIAARHGLTTAQLIELNKGLTENSLLQIDQKINVTVEKPLVNVEVIKEKRTVHVMPFEKIIKEDDTMYKGDTIEKQQGSKGKKEVSYLISELNGSVAGKKVTDETVLSEPVDQVTVVGTKVVSSRGTGEFAWPAVGGYISSEMGSRWGSYHRGIDIARPSNYNILASDNGVVTFTGWDGTYGQKIVVDHNNGYQTIYAHLSEIDVNVGQVVPQGSVMGIMGSTGRSTGTHLHFEIHKNGSLVNPLSYLN